MKRTLFLALAFSATLSQAGYSIDLYPRVQEKTNWSWAACMQMILDKYNIFVSQTQLAKYALGNERDDGVDIGQNITAGISMANQLLYWSNISSVVYERALTLAELTTELSQGHLVVARRYSGICLVYAINGSTVSYVEPYPGFGVTSVSFDTFTYNEGYGWNGSLVVTTSLPAASSRPAKLITETNVPKAYALVGVDQLYINDGAVCYNNTTTTTSYCTVYNSWATSLTNHYWNNAITLGVDAKVGHTYLRGSLFMRERASINGNLFMSDTTLITRQNSTSITGTTNKSTTLSYLGFGWGSIDYTGVTKTNINLEPDQSRYFLSPGKYYDVTVKQRTPIRLSAGIYYFNSFNCDGCTLELDASSGPIRVYIQTYWGWTNATQTFVSGDATKLMVAYLGTEAVYLNANFTGTILAPAAHLVLGQTAKTYVGMFQGKLLTVHQYSTVRYSPFNFYQ